MSKENNFDNSLTGLLPFKEYLISIKKCNVCGSARRAVWASSKFLPTYVCKDCGLVYFGKQLNKEGREKFYSSGYFELQNEDEDSRKRLKMYKLEVDFLENHKKSGKLLDVGCGGGFFLSKFNSRWKKYGLEIDPRAVEYANKTYPSYKIVAGEVEDVDYPKNFFDAIVMRGVVEHFTDPTESVGRLSKWLKKGGLLYITSTPNVESLCAKLYRDKWKLFAAAHQYHFSVRTLEKMMKPLGLCLVDSHYFYLETPYANEEKDLEKVMMDAELIFRGRREKVRESPAFYGSMLSVIFKKS